MVEAIRKRNRLVPWNIGTAIILAVVGFVGYRMWVNDCGAPVASELGG